MARDANKIEHIQRFIIKRGCDNAFVMKQALKDYKNKEKHDFPQKSLEQIKSGRRYRFSTMIPRQDAEVSSGFPAINEDPSPRRQKRKRKKGRLQDTKIQEI